MSSSTFQPLAPVERHRFLHYQIENWIAQGVRSFVFYTTKQTSSTDSSSNGSAACWRNAQWNQLSNPSRSIPDSAAVAYAIRQIPASTESFWSLTRTLG